MKRNRLVIVGVMILAFVFILMPVVSNNAWSQQVAQSGGAGTAAGAGAAGAGGAEGLSTAAIVGIVVGAAAAIALAAAAINGNDRATAGHATAGH
jgi:hypothetical protein